MGQEDLDFDCGFFGGGETIESQPMVAVQFSALNGEVVALKRDPAELVIARGPSPWATVASIPLGGARTTDTGHDLFHRDGGAGLACASCHPEGGEDGRTWSFSDVGKRRTQALNIGLEGTAPFHWGGDLPGVSDLMREVFVLRMGGVHESPERLEALESWLFTLLPPEPIRHIEDPGALRGEELFHSAETGCATCHSGEQLTDNSTVTVRAGDPPLQVPSLIGIGYRSPFMHDGCAETLSDRFNDSCGGGQMHGRTSQLSATQIDDLVAYLESL
jgi:cytochrome c553